MQANIPSADEARYHQRLWDADFVRGKIWKHEPDEVFRLNDPSDPRIFMLFKSEDKKRNFVFYTGVIGAPDTNKPTIITGGDRDYSRTRVLHHADVTIEGRMVDWTFKKTEIVDEERLNEQLQLIACERFAARRGVRSVGGRRFKRLVESAQSLRKEDKTSQIH